MQVNNLLIKIFFVSCNFKLIVDLLFLIGKAMVSRCTERGPKEEADSQGIGRHQRKCCRAKILQN